MASAAIIKSENSLFAVIFNTKDEQQLIINKVNSSSFNGMTYQHSVLAEHVPARVLETSLSCFMEG